MILKQHCFLFFLMGCCVLDTSAEDKKNYCFEQKITNHLCNFSVEIDKQVLPDSLRSTLNDIKDAVKKRSSINLMSLMSESPTISMGPITNATTIEYLGISEKESPGWEKLDKLLVVPGMVTQKNSRSFCIPFFTSHLTEPVIESPDFRYVFRKNSFLKRTNTCGAESIEPLDFQLVKIVERGAVWSKVTAKSGSVGYIETESLLPTYGNSLCMIYFDDEWKVSSLILEH